MFAFDFAKFSETSAKPLRASGMRRKYIEAHKKQQYDNRVIPQIHACFVFSGRYFIIIIISLFIFPFREKRKKSFNFYYLHNQEEENCLGECTQEHEKIYDFILEYFRNLSFFLISSLFNLIESNKNSTNIHIHSPTDNFIKMQNV